MFLSIFIKEFSWNRIIITCFFGFEMCLGLFWNLCLYCLNVFIESRGFLLCFWFILIVMPMPNKKNIQVDIEADFLVEMIWVEMVYEDIKVIKLSIKGVRQISIFIIYIPFICRNIKKITIKLQTSHCRLGKNGQCLIRLSHHPIVVRLY